jgi:hypothetical protein
MVLFEKARSNMEQKMISDGKFICNANNETFNTKVDYDIHCLEAHLKSDNKNW